MNPSSRGIFLLVLLLLFIGHSAWAGCRYVYVKRVVDGDTFVFSKNTKVRLLGVDTPESVAGSRPVQWYGKRSYWWLAEMIQGKRVCLKRDPNKQIDKDHYGRLLRYVWVDGLFINREIIRQGLGRLYHREPFKYLSEFRSLEFEAIRQGKGLWNLKEQMKWKEKIIRNLKLLAQCSDLEGIICPWQARGYIGHRKTVRMFVHKTHDAGRRFLLNSEVDYRAWDNLTVVVLKGRRSALELDRRFWGKTIEVTGTITEYKGRPEIVIKSADSIKIIN